MYFNNHDRHWSLSSMKLIGHVFPILIFINSVRIDVNSVSINMEKWINKNQNRKKRMSYQLHVYMKLNMCTVWFDTYMYCKTFTTIKLKSFTSHNCHFFWMKWDRNMYLWHVLHNWGGWVLSHIILLWLKGKSYSENLSWP